ncbi:hypothetical protein EB796_009150 [Bugula neritina]|uniref:Uncharacterized protein n=1 Tax=Bugula neritina TaxID=10212 RepID=A0A7J7K1P2_BUGNE|nr:hypothetical protein EB796_009150 [Bugula neritina]
MDLKSAHVLLALCTLLGYASGTVLPSEEFKEYVEVLQSKIQSLEDRLESLELHQKETQKLEDRLKSLEDKMKEQELKMKEQSQVNEDLRNLIHSQRHTINSLLHALLNGQLPEADDLEVSYDEDMAKLLNQICVFGRDGYPGQKGDKGAFGFQGLPGLPGIKGIRGLDGAKGAKGDDGIKGAKGASGVQGIRGVPGLPGATSEVESGAVYTRWGRHTCESVSVTLYEGFAGGSYYSHTGGGVNYQCLPLKDPQYNKYYTGGNGWWGDWISGVEYEFVAGTGIFPDSTYNQNVPCARCYTKTRSAVVMIPAKRQCPAKWTKEYEGYLMTNHYDHAHPTTYECVDAEPEHLRGMEADVRGALFYFVRTDCTGYGTTGQCPPYEADKQLTCVVCTK